ncbi:PQQ-dependent sugar dehydrogenase [Micromonospora sp. NPDC049559]|uniref:PQQ-dependent sugar dehydrogenase n=1 Tax=Micromonospora sp. NPDC049559 TaxID=3155923 RepID=UPI00342F9F72
MAEESRRARVRALAVVAGLAVVLGPVAGPGAGPARAVVPPGFTEQVVLAGLTQPTKLAFAPDGRVFVAQKNGIIKIFDSLTDPTPTVFADLRPQVYDYADLGLVGLALPPGFPADPWVYVSYTYDGPIGGTAPTYGDSCPAPNTCLASARVSLLHISGNVMNLPERVLLHDWCQQSDTHSIGDIGFGPDGALYVGGGDGASGSVIDYGQLGAPANPCGDPPAPVGGVMSPPTAEGGALRSQDVRTPTDPTGLDGTLIRVHPTTGQALADNPLAASADRNTRRIVAYGLRNAFRWTFRPGTGEVWIGDVGWRLWEEIDRVRTPAVAPVRNYGWPCYEGPAVQPPYHTVGLNLCRSLYAAPAGTVTPPYYAYARSQPVVPGDGCPVPAGVISGLAFYPASGGGFPAAYRRALFFADYRRGCVWAMRAGATGLPDPATITLMSNTAGGVVDLQVGPDRNLYYVDLTGGTVRRLRFG